MPVVTKVKSKVQPRSTGEEIKSSIKPRENQDGSQREDQQMGDQALRKAAPRKRKCHFCSSKNEPLYWDAASLRRFINDRGRIVPRSRSGACSKHQRRVSKQIKYARQLALLPFMVRA